MDRTKNSNESFITNHVNIILWQDLCQRFANENHCHLRCLPIQFTSHKILSPSCAVVQGFQREETKLQNLSKEWEIGCLRYNTTLLQDCRENFQSCLVIELGVHDSKMEKQFYFLSSWMDFKIFVQLLRQAS